LILGREYFLEMPTVRMMGDITLVENLGGADAL
jgi:hypothetical protein